MPEIITTSALVWENGASLFGDSTVLPWQEGVSIYSEGGAFTPSAPPGGGTVTSPNLDARALVSAATYYDASATWTVTDIRDNQPVEVESLSFNTDEDALFWAVSLTGGQALYDKLAAGDQPPTVSVALAGQEWRFVIEDLPLQRKHGDVQARARGRSLTCLAGAPYELEQNWSLSGDTTALQLATAANLGTELQVEWGLKDWPIPDGVFSHSGTPLSVVKRVADAVGAMVQSDPREYSVKVLPRYDLLPNEWPVVPPDAEIAEAAIDSDGYEDASRPAYDGVYVFGQQGGAAAFVRLAGTSGANLKPMVTDALLTHVDACSQRGMAELARSGEQRRHTLTLPVYAGSGQPGVLMVGRIVKIGAAAPWWGVVRSVSVQARHGDISQTVTLERHTKIVDGMVAGSGITSPLRFEGPIPNQTVTTGAVFSLNLSTYFAAGVPAYAYFMRSGALPSWLDLNRNTGYVTGTAPGAPVAATAVQFRTSDSINSTADTNVLNITVVSAAVHLTAIGRSGRRVANADSASSTWTVPGTNAPYSSALSGAYNGARLVVSTSSYQLWYSADLGASWTQATAISNFNNSFSTLYGYTDRLVRTTAGFIVPLIYNAATSMTLKNLVSTDGVTWNLVSPTSYPLNIERAYRCVAIEDAIYAITYFAGSEFPPGGGAPLSDAASAVAVSADGGYTWGGGVGFDPTSFRIDGILIGAGTTMLIDTIGSRVKTSTGGLGGSWTNVTLPLAPCPRQGAFGAGKFVLPIVGGSIFMVSDNGGASWSSINVSGLYSASTYNVIEDFIYDGTAFVAMYSSGEDNTSKILKSADGVTWTAYTGPNINPVKLVITQ